MLATRRGRQAGIEARVAWDLLHAGLGWPVAGALISVSFVSSLITVALGIGGGTVMLAVLATLLPGGAIIPVHGLVQLGSNVGRAALMARHVERGVVWPFALGAAAGVSLGGLFVVQLDPATIQIAVGLFILWTILARPPAFLRRSAALAGAFSSFLTMFVGGTGPFVAAFGRAQGFGRMGYVATHATLMTLQHLLKSVVFGLLGFAFSQWLGLIVLLIGSGFLGTVAGRQLLFRIDEARFRLALSLVLGLLALRLIYAGGVALLGAGG